MIPSPHLQQLMEIVVQIAVREMQKENPTRDSSGSQNHNSELESRIDGNTNAQDVGSETR